MEKEDFKEYAQGCLGCLGIIVLFAVGMLLFGLLMECELLQTIVCWGWGCHLGGWGLLIILCIIVGICKIAKEIIKDNPERKLVTFVKRLGVVIVICVVVGAILTCVFRGCEPIWESIDNFNPDAEHLGRQ